ASRSVGVGSACAKRSSRRRCWRSCDRISASVFKASLQVPDTLTLAGCKAGQLLQVAVAGVETLQLCRGVGNRQRRPQVGPVDRTGEECFALGEVAGQESPAVLFLAFDQQFVGPGDVLADLAIRDTPPLFGTILNDVVELGTVEPDAEHLLD